MRCPGCPAPAIPTIRYSPACRTCSWAAIIQGLRDRGLDATHAAILGGNIERESGFDPSKPNIAEGGIGLIQWRLERRAALQRLARLRHKSETDAGTQLDFMMSELKDTPEGRAFLAAHDPESMNRALHAHIRYGDNSEGLRLAYGKSLLPLAEKSQPGSLLAAATKAGMTGGGATTVTGSATLKVDVNAPQGTSVKADADGLFDRVQVNRGLAMSDANRAD
jgi:Phage tail lysozyme